jgi:hypothetical protein
LPLRHVRSFLSILSHPCAILPLYS